MTMRWHLLTGEYPPDSGGVGDYTAVLAAALAAAGDEVHVWSPSGQTDDSRIQLHQLPDTFGAETRVRLATAFEAVPGRILLQYVPNALGARGANLRFCRWLAAERRRGRDIRVMFHEPYFYFTLRHPARNALAIVQRTMAATLLRAATQVYFSSSNWDRYLRPYGSVERAATLPIPSTIPSEADPSRVAYWRERFRAAGGEPVAGHFGTYGDHLATELEAWLPAVLAAAPGMRVACIGGGSEPFVARFTALHRHAGARIAATGRVTAEDVAAALRACDLALQPYPDGVTTRRTSVMACLANGVPTVTTDGFLTEPIWRDQEPVALVAAGDPAAAAAAVVGLLDNPEARMALGTRGRLAHDRHFSIARTVDVLRHDLVPAGAGTR